MTVAPPAPAGTQPTHARAAITGTASLLGGAAWIAAALLHAGQPEGCVGDACSTTSMREATTATSVLVGLAIVLLAAGGLGLLRLVGRTGGLGRAGRAGVALCVLGTASVVAGLVTQAVLADGDAPWMPWFVWPGVGAVAVGAALFGWAVLRSRVVPTWIGAALVAAAVLLPLANEQTSAVLLAVPFGLAWTAAGLALLRAR